MAKNWDLNSDGFIDLFDVNYLLEALSGDEEKAAVCKEKLEQDSLSINDVTALLNICSEDRAAGTTTPVSTGTQIMYQGNSTTTHIKIGTSVDETLVKNKVYVVDGPVVIE